MSSLKQRVDALGDDADVLHRVAGQRGAFNLTIFAMKMMRGIREIRVMASVVPADHPPVVEQQCVGVLAGRLSEVQFETVVPFQFDADLSDEIASGSDVRAERDENAQRVSKWISHVTMLWFNCTWASWSTALHHSMASSQAGCSAIWRDSSRRLSSASEQAYLRSKPAMLWRRNCSRDAIAAPSFFTASSVTDGGSVWGDAFTTAMPIYPF